MVFGEIKKIENKTMTMKAMKITDLSDNPINKEMWKDEVIEAKMIYDILEKKK